MTGYPGQVLKRVVEGYTIHYRHGTTDELVLAPEYWPYPR